MEETTCTPERVVYLTLKALMTFKKKDLDLPQGVSTTPHVSTTSPGSALAPPCSRQSCSSHPTPSPWSPPHVVCSHPATRILVLRASPKPVLSFIPIYVSYFQKCGGPGGPNPSHVDHAFLFQWTPKREKFLDTYNSGGIRDVTSAHPSQALPLSEML